MVAGLALGALTAVADSPCEWETDYHCVSIEADPARGGFHLLLDNEHNSFVDLEDPTHLAYVYTRWIADAIDSTSDRGTRSTSSSSAAAPSPCPTGCRPPGRARARACSSSTAR